MGKHRKWQLFCILSVIILTLYNIAPTLLYYARPLQAPVDVAQSLVIARDIEQRVNRLEKESIDWVRSFCSLLSLKPESVFLNPDHPQWISVHFTKAADAKKFRDFFDRAGTSIPFGPAQLHTNPLEKDPKAVLIQRQIPYHISKETPLFSFAQKGDLFDQQLILNRAVQIVQALAQEAPPVTALQALFKQEGKFSFGPQDSLFKEISIDFEKESFLLTLHSETSSRVLANAAHRLRFCNEKIELTKAGFRIPFHTLSERSGSLVLDLHQLASCEIQQLISALKTHWNPTHPDLQALTIVNGDDYTKLSPEEKGLCILAFSPSSSLLDPAHNSDSLYLAIKGLERIGQNYAEHTQSHLAQLFKTDLQALYTLLAHHGFSSQSQGIQAPCGSDVLLEKSHFALPFLAATREEFKLTTDKKYALLDLSTQGQRALVENKIDTAMHQELIQWGDDYLASQVSLDAFQRYTVPKPTRNILWSNFTLSLKKMLRGDERKILRWGLDLSGGKTVEIELRDDHHNVVQSDAEIKQGMSELYKRVNKMGLSEVSIRQVGNHIVLDFPGSQSLSASDLIQASSMYFYIVNEKFALHNPTLGDTVNRFLQSVWDEAVFLNKTDVESIQEIAKKHLSSTDGLKLKEQGLKFFDSSLEKAEEEKTLSRVLIQKGSSPLEWHGATHPLLIAFYSHALEGAQLENIHSAYDPSRGNYLSFSIASSHQTRDGILTNPQQILYNWTSQYAKESIAGTANETHSRGRGWRMAVVLNDTVINAPTLDSALKDSAMISGHFSQTEVQRLATDLKAGSMTFTPHILSEKNVSPELGKTDRMQGIFATVAALLLVIGSMLAYYRFAGLVASIAVLFNLLILWGVLQNLGAALSLAGIAGIILTVGMSIDANVLVFERIKEELSLGKSLPSAISTGYKKAFSAILDSNVTTIIAALILLNFDAGPIKSFAMNLIIGITASMFTALFMTRFYFTGWAQNKKNQTLKMAHWIRDTSFNFLKQTRVAFALAALIISVGLGSLFFHSSSILGLDFTGGFSLHLEVKAIPDLQDSYAARVGQAFLKQGAEKRDFQIQEMTPTNQLRVLFAENMEQKGKPFYQLPLETKDFDPLSSHYDYEKNPRILWVVGALEKEGIVLTEESLASLHSEWTAVSGQMSDTMRNQALLGFTLSFIAIFIYLAFRFEYKFAAAALLCLVHDLLITLAVLGLMHALNVPIQIDLITIAALMTAVGYSLNDTIIIFDRIREEIQRDSKKTLLSVVNSALNSTLSRTLITSGTTLFVLIALLVLGGSSIFGFACVMTIGVVFGTLSSWFIAAPLMLFFHRREEGSQNPLGQLSQHVK